MIELLSGPFGPVLIFLLRIADVSLGTLRLVSVTRGERLAASLIGVVEVLIWVTAVGSALQNLQSPLHLAGYACGFGAGTWVGMWIEERFPLGTATVQAFCRDADVDLAEALRSEGLGATTVRGEGHDGPVEMVSTVVPRRIVPRVIEAIEAKDPDAFITVYDARIRRGWVGTMRRK